MNTRIFDYEMTDRDTISLQDGERLYQIITSNGMDALYIIAAPEDAEEAARAGMRARFGRRGPAMIERMDDVTGRV